MPPLTSLPEDDWDDPPLSGWVRGALVGVVLGLVGVFALAARLDPYEDDGTPRRHGTHRMPPLDLPPCTFLYTTGRPCPSCGMTTSFALLMHGDVLNSLRANWVGTLLALFGLVLIPWGLAAVVRKRAPFVASVEVGLATVVCVFMVLALLRWGVVLALGGWVVGWLGG